MTLTLTVNKLEKLQLGVVVRTQYGDQLTQVRTCSDPLYYTTMPMVCLDQTRSNPGIDM